MAIRVDASSDTRWIRITVHDSANPENTANAIVAIDRDALEEILQADPRPPEVLLDLIAERAVRRMPVANGDDGIRLITSYNVSLVWPK
ncbi:MAG: hypothetical protein ACYCT0_11370 [Sulfobacillus sp.]